MMAMHCTLPGTRLFSKLLVDCCRVTSTFGSGHGACSMRNGQAIESQTAPAQSIDKGTSLAGSLAATHNASARVGRLQDQEGSRAVGSEDQESPAIPEAAKVARVGDLRQHLAVVASGLRQRTAVGAGRGEAS